MIKNRGLLFFIGILLFLVSCHKKTVSELNKKTVENICYETSIISKEFMQQQDTVEIADLIYFKLTIYEIKNNLSIQKLYNQANYNNLLFYINTRIKNDFTLKIGEIEESPIQVYFENNNRMSDKLVFLLAFEKPNKNSEEVLLSFNDNIFNNGIINFRFNTI